MSVNYNRFLGDWRCLKAALLVAAEKIFGEPETWGPLVPVHDEIRKQPCFWLLLLFKPFHEDRIIILFTQGTLVVFLLISTR